MKLRFTSLWLSMNEVYVRLAMGFGGLTPTHSLAPVRPWIRVVTYYLPYLFQLCMARDLGYMLRRWYLYSYAYMVFGF